MEELVSQRVYGIALGYEDIIDHEWLRKDWLLATMVGKADPSGEDRKRARDQGSALAGKSTLNRLELVPGSGVGSDRYKKIGYGTEAIDRLCWWTCSWTPTSQSLFATVVRNLTYGYPLRL